MIKGPTHEKLQYNNCKYLHTNTGTPEYTKQVLTDLKGEMYKIK